MLDMLEHLLSLTEPAKDYLSIDSRERWSEIAAKVADMREQPSEIRVICFVEGGVVQGARASVPVNFNVFDQDNRDATEDEAEIAEFDTLLAEYESLPEPIY